MARIFFSIKLWEATSSIDVMKMLANQAETTITRSLSEADLPDAVTQGELEQDAVDEEGNWHSFMVPYFSCGSCSGYDAEEVREKYKHLISQLSRRSAFLTMFGLFENRMIGCLDVMNILSGEVSNKVFKTLDDCHKKLRTIGVQDIMDADHLAVIRNIMAHSDAVAVNYHALLKPNVKTSESQKRQIRGLHRAISDNAGISISDFNVVVMDERFLDYAVREFERYVTEVDAAIRNYQKQISSISPSERRLRGS